MSPEAQMAIRKRWHADLPLVLEGKDPFLTPRDTDLESVPEVDCFEVMDAVCEVTNLNRDEIMGQQRRRCVARPRQIIYALLRARHPAMMDAEIARFMGRHQTTIAHGVKQITRFMEYEPETKRVYHEAERRLSVR